MASSEAASFASEWEVRKFSQSNEEESEIEGEEFVTKNKTWFSCTKLQTNPNYHQGYIPINDAINYRNLSTCEGREEKFMSLASEDKAFLSSEKATKFLQEISNAVACITVTRPTRTDYGTGFFVNVNNKAVVITNSHSVRSLASGNGIEFDIVKPENVTVICFYDGSCDFQVECEVERMEFASPPKLNMGQNVLQRTMQRSLSGDGSKNLDEVNKCDAVIQILSAYFNRRDAFLDYVLLHLKPLQDDSLKSAFNKIQALEMKKFMVLDNFKNVSSFGATDPRRSKYPKSLRLFTISHPHGHSKVVSFGEMKSSLTHAFFLNMAYGQNDTGMIEGKEPFVEHSVTTCPGSSGAPIFFYVYNHETSDVEMDEGVFFLHFFGIPAKQNGGQLHGKAASFSTILNNLENQALHAQLQEAFYEVGHQPNNKENDS